MYAGSPTKKFALLVFYLFLNPEVITLTVCDFVSVRKMAGWEMKDN